MLNISKQNVSPYYTMNHHFCVLILSHFLSLPQVFLLL